MDLDAFEAQLVKEMVECDMDVERIRPPALSPEKLARYAQAADHGLHGVLYDETTTTSSSTGKSPRALRKYFLKPRAKTPPRPWKEKAKRPVRLDATKHEAKLKEVLGRELLSSERMETKEVFCLSETAGQPVAALSLAYGKALLQRNGRLPTPSRGASKSTKGGGDGGVPP